MAYRDPDGGWFKSSNDAVIGGVCSGISEKLKIDVTIIRLIFAVAFLVYGTGLGIYIILWILLPERK